MQGAVSGFGSWGVGLLEAPSPVVVWKWMLAVAEVVSVGGWQEGSLLGGYGSMVLLQGLASHSYVVVCGGLLGNLHWNGLGWRPCGVSGTPPPFILMSVRVQLHGLNVEQVCSC